MALTTALVTGGAGFIGSHLVDRLLAEGVRVTVVDDLSTGNRANVARRAKLIQADIRDPKVANFIEKFRPDAIFHFAAQKNVRYSLENPVDDASTNVLGSLALLEAARKAKVRNFIFASTGGAIYDGASTRPTVESALARPLSPYGIGKRSFEHYLDAYAEVYGMRTLALRFSNVYGPRQDPKGEAGVVAIFFSAILKGRRPSIFGKGDKTRDYIYVDDVVDACWRAARSRATGVYNVGTGSETSVGRLWSLIAGITKTTIAPKHVAAIPGELRWSSLSARAARRAFGWKPRVRLAEGLRRTHQWFQENAARSR
jgi:UDP-glucose 4-epimerase